MFGEISVIRALKISFWGLKELDSIHTKGPENHTTSKVQTTYQPVVPIHLRGVLGPNRRSGGSGFWVISGNMASLPVLLPHISRAEEALLDQSEYEDDGKQGD